MVLYQLTLTSCVEILKKQAAQNGIEYDRLATEYNKKTGNVSDKRKD
jgi:B-cell receptor-associated protein 31